MQIYYNHITKQSNKTVDYSVNLWYNSYVNERERIYYEKSYCNTCSFEETPVIVAEVNLPWEVISEANTVNQVLEYAYRWTNNVQGSWSMKTDFKDNGDYNEDVEVMVDLPVSRNTAQVMGLRSTSMGDFMVFDGIKYKVGMAGFKKVEIKEGKYL
tara:strand:+ start:1600 stop:2067 length:468 start_codon:yes stop_codon:yes gene_type:complete